MARKNPVQNVDTHLVMLQARFTDENIEKKISESNKVKERVEEQTIGQLASSIPYEEHRKILRKKLESYRDKLLRLEQGNRSILLRRIYGKWSFDLSKLSIRGTPPADLVIERAFHKRNAICLIPDNDDSESADKDRIKLRSLYRTLESIRIGDWIGRGISWISIPSRPCWT